MPPTHKHTASASNSIILLQLEHSNLRGPYMGSTRTGRSQTRSKHICLMSKSEWSSVRYFIRLTLCFSFFQPVCHSVDRQMPVDLTDRAVFRVGRSPQSDVQLLHATSSRAHAMLFHHSNGSCYLVDCGSAHGTYVNGVRVCSAPNGGVVVPHRVRRGSIIRFGGPGAPSFMLKSFTFNLDDMREYNVAYTPRLSPASQSNVVQHNTRLNSLGKTAKDCLTMSLSSKRSFDSVETAECEYEDCCKRMRCSSPPLSPEQAPMRLVSPEFSPSKRRRVTFSEDPPRNFYPTLVSPDVSSDENDDDQWNYYYVLISSGAKSDSNFLISENP